MLWKLTEAVGWPQGKRRRSLPGNGTVGETR